MSGAEAVRVTVRVEPVLDDASWRVTATCPAVPDLLIERVVADDPGATARAAVRQLRRGNGGTAEVGRQLFDLLLGDEWATLEGLAHRQDTSLLELALLWTPTNGALAQLPWELLHDGRRFLATSGTGVSVAVTRIVVGAEQTLAPFPLPARVLFVIGAALTDPAVRAGTEILGLVRGLSEGGHRLHHRVLTEATADGLANAVASYRPHVVHFICHGTLDAAGRGFLRLRSAEAGRETDDYPAAALLERMRHDGEVPPVVVLSACDGAGDVARRSLGGPELSAPLAVELVRGGVAVVAAMAGSVSDRACRVFSRTFARAMLEGGSLVDATAEARRLTFADVSGSGTLDWALPSVFFAEGVDAGRGESLGVADPDPTEALRRSMDLDRTPVFVARERFLESFWSMLPGPGGAWSRQGSPRTGVLAVSVDRHASGVGKTRLLEELATAALENGHLPVLIATGKDTLPPADLADLANAVAKALARLGYDLIGSAASHQKGGPSLGHQLTLIADELRGQDADDLDPRVREALDIDAGPGFQEALTLEAERLRSRVRDHFPDALAADSRLVLLVDNLAAGTLLDDLLGRRVIGSYGAGSERDPVPVVLTVQHGTEDGSGRALSERRLDKTWMQVISLLPFDTATEEDLLAYEMVLLHPFRQVDPSNRLRRRWVFNRGMDAEKWEEHTTLFRDTLAGIPARFHDVVFDVLVRSGAAASFLVEATDEADRQVVAP